MERIKYEACERDVDEVLASGKEHPLDVCVKLVRIMATSEYPHNLLRKVLEFSSPIGDPENQNPVIAPVESIDRFVRWNFRYIVHYTRLLARKNLLQDDFYQILYKDLFCPGNGMLPDSEVSRAMTLEILANHVRCVPYYQLLDEKTITNEEFVDSVHEIQEQLQVSNHILQRDFATKTEEGIQFYRLIESISGERNRIVFLSLLLGMVRSNVVVDSE